MCMCFSNVCIVAYMHVSFIGQSIYMLLHMLSIKNNKKKTTTNKQKKKKNQQQTNQQQKVIFCQEKTNYYYYYYYHYFFACQNIKLYTDHVSAMVRLSASGGGGCGLDPRLHHTKDVKTGYIAWCSGKHRLLFIACLTKYTKKSAY